VCVHRLASDAARHCNRHPSLAQRAPPKPPCCEEREDRRQAALWRPRSARVPMKMYAVPTHPQLNHKSMFICVVRVCVSLLWVERRSNAHVMCSKNDTQLYPHIHHAALTHCLRTRACAHAHTRTHARTHAHTRTLLTHAHTHTSNLSHRAQRIRAAVVEAVSCVLGGEVDPSTPFFEAGFTSKDTVSPEPTPPSTCLHTRVALALCHSCSSTG
jgi:hypothetical protein